MDLVMVCKIEKIITCLLACVLQCLHRAERRNNSSAACLVLQVARKKEVL